jgi:hypothetical protein
MYATTASGTTTRARLYLMAHPLCHRNSVFPTANPTPPFVWGTHLVLPWKRQITKHEWLLKHKRREVSLLNVNEEWSVPEDATSKALDEACHTGE